jgi:GPH family glycoside/pentoside/hexuronide:cation symporter
MTSSAAALPVAAAAPTRHRLPLRTKLAFGAGDLGPAISGALYGYFMLVFLVNVAGLAPAAAGTVLLIAKLWDAVNDPVVGWLTDHTRSRFGRRRPWLLLGALPFGLAFFLLWLVPPLGAVGKFAYYVLATMLFDTALTVVLVPFTSLTPELTPDYDERTSLTAVRMSFSIIGSTLALLIHTQVLAAFEHAPVTGYALSAAVWAAVGATGLFITFLGTREPPPPPRPAAGVTLHVGFLAGFRIAFRNRAFVLVALVYLFSWMALQFVQANLPFYIDDWVGMPTAALGYVLMAIQASTFVWLVIWTRVSERLGKQRVYYLGMAVFLAVMVVLFFVQPGQVTLVYLLAAIVGTGVAVCYLVPWSMLPDVVEVDELETGERREGIFYGMFALFQKLALALALGISGWALQIAGYVRAVPGQPDPVQPASALLALRLLIGPGGAIILIASIVAVAAYPLTRERHAEVRAALAARHAASAAPGAAAD